jgi:hypothetical protein
MLVGDAGGVRLDVIRPGQLGGKGGFRCHGVVDMRITINEAKW